VGFERKRNCNFLARSYNEGLYVGIDYHSRDNCFENISEEKAFRQNPGFI
jgi:hypothetical protein